MVETLLILIAVCIAGIVWYTLATRRRIARLERESREQLGQVRTEHEQRVDRLNRKFDAVNERGHLAFAADLLPALDALGQALKQCQQAESDAIASLRQGLEMVDEELDKVLAKHGIEKCTPKPGDAFDANVHEAVTIVERSDVDPGRVAECFRPGYVHGEQVLRSAAVSVSGEEAQPDSEATAQQD